MLEYSLGDDHETQTEVHIIYSLHSELYIHVHV